MIELDYIRKYVYKTLDWKDLALDDVEWIGYYEWLRLGWRVKTQTLVWQIKH